MADLIANADGNLTGAATFAATEAGATSKALIRANVTTLATATSITSPTFTVTNTDVVDGVLLWLFLSSGTAGTGTLKVDLQRAGVSVASVTVNKSDLPDANNAVPVAVFFKFTATHTGSGVATYTIVLTTVSGTGSGVVSYNRNSATSGDMTRVLRRTTAATAAAGDNLFVVGELTGAGTKNNRAVTMNSTAATDYGSGVVNSTSVYGGIFAIGMWGTLSYGTSAATNYTLRISGDLIVYQNGTLNIGSSGAEIPRDSTAVLEFDPVSADGDFGLRNQNGTVNAYGLSRTVGKNIVKCKLNTNEAIASTSLGVDTDTGWLDNDQIAVASTSRTAGDCEAGLLNGAAGASTLTVDGFLGAGGGLAAAHSGTSPTQAEIGLLTRNVRVRSTSSTLMAYVYCTALASLTATWAQFQYLGTSTVNKRGIELDAGATSTAKSITFCSIQDSDRNCLFLANSTNVSLNLTFSNNVMWNSTTGMVVINASITNTGEWTMDNNLGIKSGTSGFSLGDVGGTLTNNVIVGHALGSAGFDLAEVNGSNVLPIGTFSDNTAHSSAGIGISISGSAMQGTIQNFKGWRNAQSGLSITADFTVDLYWTDLLLFGNATNITMNVSAAVELNISTATICADTSFTSIGIVATINSHAILNFKSVDMSGVGSIYAAHTTREFSFGTSTSYVRVEGVFNNCKFGQPIVDDTVPWSTCSYMLFQKYNQTAGDHRAQLKYGLLKTDTSIFNTASPSMRMTPNDASSKLASAPKSKGKLFAVVSGQAITVSAQVRKSAAGDGAAYNGNQPRLVARANPAVGITTDTVIATYSAGTGAWNSLGGALPTPTDDGAVEVVIDCDGTAGWVNVDDWAIAA